MAAPDYLYTPFRKLTATRQDGTIKDVLTTSASESDTVLKQRFYLDGFIEITDNSTGTPVTSWAGACYVGSNNYYMHNTARHGWLVQKEKDTGREYVVFWDAGLNTLGTCNTPELIDDTVGLVQAKTLITTAYYNDSDRYGVNVQINNGVISQWHIDEFIAQNTIIYKNLPVIAYSYMKAGDIVKMWARVRNAEGEFTTPNYLQITVKPRIWAAKYDSTYASWANAKTSTINIYSGLAEMDYYSEVFKDVGMTQYADEGYYVIDGWWYEVRLDNTPQMKATVVAKGRAIPGEYPAGDPANPPVDNYVAVSAYFGTTRNQVCLKAMNGEPSDLSHFYVNTANNRYYTDNIGTSYVADGYYVFPDYTPSNQRWTMTSGFRATDGNCI